MKRLLTGAAALSTCAMLAVSAPAWAHVVVSPEEVAVGDYETLTVSVPTEKEVPTTKIRVKVPEGFLLSGVQPVPGWEYAFEEDGGVITAVTWYQPSCLLRARAWGSGGGGSAGAVALRKLEPRHDTESEQPAACGPRGAVGCLAAALVCPGAGPREARAGGTR